MGDKNSSGTRSSSNEHVKASIENGNKHGRTSHKAYALLSADSVDTSPSF
jgi:hypothetical protein